MSANKHKPHVLVLPEDDANRDLANGFQLGLDLPLQRRMQVLPVAGGWAGVLDRFESDEVRGLGRFPDRLMVLLIDFDGDAGRLDAVKKRIPERLMERVFVLGAWSEPENLKAQLGRPYETIGQALARDCREQTDTTWGHSLLRHNATEIERLQDRIRPILFPSA